MRGVVILDYGSGNLRSAERALRRVGAEVDITSDARAAAEADGLVVPGVGAFSACMAGLLDVGGDRIVATRLASRRPILGICVGMQILFSRGVEHGRTACGTNQWSGTVEQLRAEVLPHMGWNTVRAPGSSRLFAGLDAATRFYFVHSYAARAWQHRTERFSSEPMVTWARHGEDFVAAAEDGSLWATQFHPEKSGDAGAQLLRNWLRTL